MDGNDNQPKSYPKALANHPPQTLGELFSRPNRWNKGHNARDKEGTDCYPTSAQAVDWCAHGGIVLVYGEDKVNEITTKLLAYIGEHYPEWKERDSLTEFNDSEDTRFKDIRRCCLGARL